MNTPQLLPLDSLVLNAGNPRTISPAAFNDLIDSLIEFPEMLNLRPAVVDESLVILGGNQRTRAKIHLVGLGELDKTEILETEIERRRRDLGAGFTEAHERAARASLRSLLFDETAFVVIAEGLSDAQKLEFIFKDNTSAGSWDWDKLQVGGWAGKPLAKWGELSTPADWGSPKRKAQVTTAGAGSDDGPGNASTSVRKRKPSVRIEFDDVETLQHLEPQLLEILSREAGDDSFTLKTDLGA